MNLKHFTTMLNIIELSIPLEPIFKVFKALSFSLILEQYIDLIFMYYLHRVHKWMYL